MNILFLSNDPMIFEEGSAVRLRLCTYADEVAKTGGRLHVLSRGKGEVEIADGPLVLHPFPGNKMLALRGMLRTARTLIQALPVAVVSAQDPFEHGWIALQAAKGTNAKLHLQLHTDAFSPWFVRGGMARSPRVRVPLLNRIRRSIADRVIPHADGIRTVSQRVKDSLITRYGERMAQVSVLPIQVDAAVPAAVPLPQPAFPFTLLSVSRLEPEKRIEDILQAVAWIKAAYPAIGLVIAGSGSERHKLASLAKKLKISDRVRFLGARADARGLMRSAQAYIQASAYEGYGITLVEAALARVPIITTDVGIVGDVFKGNEDVLASPPGDPTQLAYLIRRLMIEPELRIELPMRAEAAAQAHLAGARSAPADIMADIMNLV